MLDNNETTNANVYFTFLLGDVMYAVDVHSVKEVLTYEPITKVPRTIGYLKGVMNVRGSIISVLDFRMLFELPETEINPNTSIIILEAENEDETSLSFGCVADAVEGVTELEFVDNQTKLQAGTSSANNRFVKKLARHGERFVLILDIAEVLVSIQEDLEKHSKTK